MTKLLGNLDNGIVARAFKRAVDQPASTRQDFFHEIHSALQYELEHLFRVAGIGVQREHLSHTYYLKKGRVVEIPKPVGAWRLGQQKNLGMRFCAGYGHGIYSFQALNYQIRPQLPSLKFFRETPAFSFGSFAVVVSNDDYDIDVTLEEGLQLVGYATEISKRKKKSYIALFGLSANRSLVDSVIRSLPLDAGQLSEKVDEFRLGQIHYPMLFIDRFSAQLHTCTCFAGHVDVERDLVRLLPYGGPDDLKVAVRSLRYSDGLCHLCRGGVPRQEYGHRMYYSAFMQRFLPYYNLWVRKELGKAYAEGADAKAVENSLRQHLGYPKIGEKWISETMLFRVVSALFAGLDVAHHYRGKELEGLELDVWIPSLKLGIEYQGEQHYEAVSHWGGDAGLQKRVANDQRKKRLCKQLGYTLVEFKHNEDLTEEFIRRKLSSFLRRDAEQA